MTNTAFGIIGNPLGHSMSPIIQRHFLRESGLHGNYVQYEVAGEGLETFLKEVAIPKLAGFNITTPHKKALIPLLDEVDATAQAVGAVNTVSIHDKKTHGFNTDVSGFIGSLRLRGVSLPGVQAVVMGAGGAANAVLYGLLTEGSKRIVVANRTPSRARDLAAEMASRFRGASIASCSLTPENISTCISAGTLLINSSSAGMFPGIDVTPVELSVLPEGVVAVDLVYNPLETRFLKMARALDAKVVDGLDMLILQAAEAFAIWMGRKPVFEHEELRNIIKRELANFVRT